MSRLAAPRGVASPCCRGRAMRGRTPSGPEVVERSEGSAAAKQRLRVLLEVLSGGCRLKEACERLGLKQARLGQLRRRALHGALGALEPRPGGRPRRRRGGTSDVNQPYCLLRQRYSGFGPWRLSP